MCFIQPILLSMQTLVPYQVLKKVLKHFIIFKKTRLLLNILQIAHFWDFSLYVSKLYLCTLLATILVDKFCLCSVLLMVACCMTSSSSIGNQSLRLDYQKIKVDNITYKTNRVVLYNFWCVLM